jgi:uncharacterized membrane protein YkvA (DUF1232 family)
MMQFVTKLKQRARKLKSEAQVLVVAYRDHRTPFVAKMLIGVTVGYLLSPIDLIPDFIPVLGFLDDLIIVPLLISVSIKLIPAIVLADARQSIKDNPLITKKNNWLFAILIIIVWLLLLLVAYRYFKHLWK